MESMGRKLDPPAHHMFSISTPFFPLAFIPFYLKLLTGGPGKVVGLHLLLVLWFSQLLSKVLAQQRCVETNRLGGCLCFFSRSKNIPDRSAEYLSSSFLDALCVHLLFFQL